MMAYKIINGKGVHGLGYEVRCHIRDGWEPIGGVCASAVDRGFNGSSMEYFQAMIKRKKKCS